MYGDIHTYIRVDYNIKKIFFHKNIKVFFFLSVVMKWIIFLNCNIDNNMHLQKPQNSKHSFVCCRFAGATKCRAEKEWKKEEVNKLVLSDSICY